MPIYKQTTEITNIDDLLSSVERDIEEVYFGDKRVFTVWDAYDGALPAQYSANGSTLVDYRVYGSAGGVGDVTAQLFDPNAADIEKGCYYNAEETRINNVNHNESGFIPVSPGEYTFSFIRKSGGGSFYVNFYDTSKNFVSNLSTLSGSVSETTITIQDNGYVRFNFADYFITRVMFGRGSNLSWVPYGYEVDMIVKSENMYNKNSEGNIRGYITTSGALHPSTLYGSNVLISEKIPVTPSKKYVMCNAVISGSGNGAAFYDDNDSVVSSFAIVAGQNYTLTAPNNAKYFRSTIIYGSDGNTFMFIEGEEYPSAFIPYSNTATPIYIGVDPLDANGRYADYVDYQSQKIKRWIKTCIFDGTETYIMVSNNPGIYMLPINDHINNDSSIAYSSNYYTWWKWIGNGAQYAGAPDKSLFAFTNFGIYIKDTDYLTREDFKNHVKALYNAGTPLTITYVTRAYYNTNPPVPLPAIPTVDSTNIVDYSGQSTAVPSRFYAKNRKEGY